MRSSAIHVQSQPFAIGLFIRNYLLGDEERVLEVLELPDVDFLRHGLLSDMLEVLVPCSLSLFRALETGMS